MRKLSKTSTTVVIGVAAGTLALSGIAYAYWTTSGSGVGSATSSAGAANLTVTQGTVPLALAPSVASVSVPGTITNAPNSAYVTSLRVTISSVTNVGTPDATHPACTVADYGLAAVSGVLVKGSAVQTILLTVNDELNSGEIVNFPAVTIGFANDAAANQDTCKSATPQLSFTVA